MNVCFTQYISIDDFLITTTKKKKTYPPSEPSASLLSQIIALRCWAFAWLNDCANGDEADITFVQTQKKRKFSNTGFVSRDQSTKSGAHKAPLWDAAAL